MYLAISSHKLSLNSGKCKPLLISRKRLPIDSPILYVGEPALEHVSEHKYLGIVISADLPWSNHIKGIASKARQQIGLLYRRFYKHVHQDTLRALLCCSRSSPFGIWSTCVGSSFTIRHQCFGDSSEICD